ncbi:MAG TPA: TIGR03618 family F420-dependent PPOX class oxidoreductase [Baekduia sp.]|uniref:TIGR03618 family F420-dependent PPOX class oxidoreductase n=1 Tax=Baekduia sp. TaxID=2600305 RepID=UPI002C416A2B|nr:TIGR03618 family F420-dependent PPOX class oxidoreductase [Baekduia sp.]HMJ34763.1 TIGR03618 family F420-dependent PPOX class oxidoreductase [Baekduia sp.]
MASKLEGRAREIVQDKNFAHLSVPRTDGSIQSVVVWADADDQGRVVVNSAEGRGWPNNLRRAGQATISVANAENPYEFVSIVATIDEDTQDGADDVIDALAKKYLDVDSYPGRTADEQRVTFRLAPERVVLRGN